jgi:Tol biopolymer transport system component
MKRRAIFAGSVMLGLLLTGGMSAQQSDSAAAMLRTATDKAQVDGDLNGAVRQYQAIVDRFARTDRAIAVQALLGIADCYQKLGDPASKQIYERIVTEFSDQKDAVSIARQHVPAGDTAQGGKGDRSLWSGDKADGYGTISPDGRFLSYTDWEHDATLMLRDLTTGNDRQLSTQPPPRSGVQYSAISKDGRLIAYEWFSPDHADELRIAALSGTGIPDYRPFLMRGEIQNIYPMDWSADGKWIAARVVRKDRTSQIALVSTNDGALRVLKSMDWSDRDTKIFFSPDGRYIAYSQTNASAPSQSGIFLMAADGSRENAAVVHPSTNRVMGWSPDGKYLLFASDRSGSLGLWTIAIVDGKPQGQPRLAKPSIASTWSVGVTASGTLYTWKTAGSAYVQVSSIDLNAGTLQGPSAGVYQRFILSRGRPEWSADGSQLAFEDCGPIGGGHCAMFVWNMKTGQTRELKHQLDYVQFSNWSPDGRELLVLGNDPKGKKAIYRIDAATGATSPVIEGDTVGYAQWTPDGKAIYYKGGQTQGAIRRHDLATGAETDVARAPAAPFALSPDGKSIAEIESSNNVAVISVESGQSRSVFRVTAPERLRSVSPVAAAWTPDSRAVLVMKEFDGSTRTELWEVPIDARPPRKLNIDTANWERGGYRLSPDGTHIAFVAAAGTPGSEIWAMENIVPKTNNR